MCGPLSHDRRARRPMPSFEPITKTLKTTDRLRRSKKTATVTQRRPESVHAHPLTSGRLSRPASITGNRDRRYVRPPQHQHRHQHSTPHDQRKPSSASAPGLRRQAGIQRGSSGHHHRHRSYRPRGTADRPTPIAESTPVSQPSFVTPPPRGRESSASPVKAPRARNQHR
jgi:hypothetical protein